MLKSISRQKLAKAAAPQTQVRHKGYIHPGGRISVPKRVPRKLRIGETRPAIYYKFDQVIELSDGSTVTRRSPFPRLEWKYLNDQRNNPLWNPSMPDLRAIELDASGRLAKFRKKFADLGSEEQSGTEKKDKKDAFDLDTLLSEGAEQVTTGKLHQQPKGKKK